MHILCIASQREKTDSAGWVGQSLTAISIGPAHSELLQERGQWGTLGREDVHRTDDQKQTEPVATPLRLSIHRRRRVGRL